jgi:hypothetical protein
VPLTPWEASCGFTVAESFAACLGLGFLFLMSAFALLGLTLAVDDALVNGGSGALCGPALCDGGEGVSTSDSPSSEDNVRSSLPVLDDDDAELVVAAVVEPAEAKGEYVTAREVLNREEYGPLPA